MENTATFKKLADELEEIKKSLSFFFVFFWSEEISKVEEVQELKATIKPKNQEIELLEQRIEDLELYFDVNDLIITGLDTKRRSSARAAARDQQGEHVPPEELHTFEEQVVQFFNSKNVDLEREHISACHTQCT